VLRRILPESYELTPTESGSFLTFDTDPDVAELQGIGSGESLDGVDFDR
jgi:hypothetical protein